MGSGCSMRNPKVHSRFVENRRVLLRDCSLRQPLGQFRHRKHFELQGSLPVMNGSVPMMRCIELSWMSHQMEKRQPTNSTLNREREREKERKGCCITLAHVLHVWCLSTLVSRYMCNSVVIQWSLPQCPSIRRTPSSIYIYIYRYV